MTGIQDKMKAVKKLNNLLERTVTRGKQMFRGVRDKDKHKPIPKIGRGDYSKDKEMIIFESFRKQAIPFLDSLGITPDNDWDSPQSKWDWLSIAQHFGLATRLLDWTDNILVALYFACRNGTKNLRDAKIDGLIYVLELDAYEELEHDKLLRLQDPFNDLSDEFYIFRPKDITSHIFRQQGLFTINKDPQREITSQSQYTIEAELKNSLLDLLDDIGINEKTLFPGLDSLADYINTNYHRFR